MESRTLYPGLVTSLWLLPLLAIIQAGAAGHFEIRDALPNIILVAVVDWGILRGMEEGMLWAFLGGLLLDVFSGYPLGTNTAALVITASVVSLGQGTFIRTHTLLPLATVFGATILYYLIILFILASTQHPIALLPILRGITLPSALFNAVINIPGFLLIRRLEARVYPVPRAVW